MLTGHGNDVMLLSAIFEIVSLMSIRFCVFRLIKYFLPFITSVWALARSLNGWDGWMFPQISNFAHEFFFLSFFLCKLKFLRDRYGKIMNGFSYHDL